MDSVSLSLEVLVQSRNDRFKFINVWLKFAASSAVRNLALSACHLLILRVDVIILVINVNVSLLLSDELVEHLASLLGLNVLFAFLESVSLGLILTEPVAFAVQFCILFQSLVLGSSSSLLLCKLNQIFVSARLQKFLFILNIIDIVALPEEVSLYVIGSRANLSLTAVHEVFVHGLSFVSICNLSQIFR